MNYKLQKLRINHIVCITYFIALSTYCIVFVIWNVKSTLVQRWHLSLKLDKNCFEWHIRFLLLYQNWYWESWNLLTLLLSNYILLSWQPFCFSSSRCWDPGFTRMTYRKWSQSAHPELPLCPIRFQGYWAMALHLWNLLLRCLLKLPLWPWMNPRRPLLQQLTVSTMRVHWGCPVWGAFPESNFSRSFCRCQ